MDELLSLSIPTRNRAQYLKELLQSIENQIKINSNISNDLKIYVFDNGSNDDTCEVVKKSNLDIIYKNNNENIGGERNVYQAYTSVEGKYVWVIGDDELLSEKAIDYIIQLIKCYNPHLIINRGGYKTFIEPWIFPRYLDFTITAMQKDPYLLIAHSLISANIILKSCFDDEFAMQKMGSHYAQFYGMIKGLMTFPGAVLIPHEDTVIVRTNRASPIDGIWPDDISRCHALYLEWFYKEYNLNH